MSYPRYFETGSTWLDKSRAIARYPFWSKSILAVYSHREGKWGWGLSQKIFSSRRIAKALRESIPFMWLSGNNRPDFRTINRFRGELLKGIIEEVFLAMLDLLIEGGYVKLEDYFVDGTKVEANANRYTYVWAKSTQRYQKQLAEKVAVLLAEIERVNAEEDARYGDGDLEEVGEDGPMPEWEALALSLDRTPDDSEWVSDRTQGLRV